MSVPPAPEGPGRMLRVEGSLAAFSALTRPYAAGLERALAADDGMYLDDDHDYLTCGASALHVILSALQLAGVGTPGAVLDFGAGAGRVTRWLRAAFPDARLAACDLREADMAFCRARFAAEAWISGTDVAALSAPSTYDLIWVGSVFTHLPADVCVRLFDTLLRWTNPGGIVAASTIGRRAKARVESGELKLTPAGWDGIAAAYAGRGFGYADYPDQSGYGLALAKLSWIARLIETTREARLLSLSEAVWDGLHDVVAVQKTAMPSVEGGSPLDPRLPHRAAQAAEAAGLDQEVAALRARLAALESSTSWRVTEPLRRAKRLFGG